MKTLILALSVASSLALGGCVSSQTKQLSAEDLIKAQQAQPDYNKVAAYTPTQPIASPKAATNAIEQYYPIDQTERWVALVLEGGAQVKLNDGSVWEIAPSYQPRTRFWSVADKILVKQNPNDKYPFALVNNTKPYTAHARLIAK